MNLSAHPTPIVYPTHKQTSNEQQELIDNWSDYNIRYNSQVIVLDPKNDAKKILVENYWSTVEDQETWTKLVNGTKTARNCPINRVCRNEIREIWVSDNQFYGYQPVEKEAALA
ncbi:hypothetical protein N9219_05195 [bacterium]|nr:hypothetical protein [bacterium]